jgi:hypothetical protein
MSIFIKIDIFPLPDMKIEEKTSPTPFLFPTIKDPHSPSESLQTQAVDGTETVQEFYDAVSQILGKVFAA